MTDFMTLRIWDDNPSLDDFLGFDAVVDPIVKAIGTTNVDPLAIGVHSPWGGGKSTVLNLLEKRLESAGRYVVLRTDPWQYDNHDDVRGSLIAEVLDQLGAAFQADATVKDRISDLFKRISWTRVGLALGKGALTMQWKPDELIEAFTPKARSDDKSMSGFRDSFDKLVAGLPDVDRVVVMVDDLDRCLPPAVMATLEGIKLFLAVPKMVFVVAADQEMVRDSIAVSLGETNRSGAFATRYLEKIVQLPVTLPRLATADAEAYIGMLLIQAEGADRNEIEALANHCSGRRQLGVTPLLGDLGELSRKPSEESLSLAAQLAEGLSADRLANPRQIKRFLNTLTLRLAIAEERGIDEDVNPAVLAKLMLAERFKDDFFQRIEAEAAVSGTSRTIETLEANLAETDTGRKPPKVVTKTAGAKAEDLPVDMYPAWQQSLGSGHAMTLIADRQSGYRSSYDRTTVGAPHMRKPRVPRMSVVGHPERSRAATDTDRYWSRCR